MKIVRGPQRPGPGGVRCPGWPTAGLLALRAVSVLLAAALIGTAPARGGEVLRIGGTGGALGALRLVAEAYTGAHPGTAVEILPSLGSTGAIRAVASGVVDVGIASRELRRDEKDLGLEIVPYARTPLVFVVNPSCGLDSITRSQLVGFYGGENILCPSCGIRLRIVLRPAGDSDTLVLRTLSPAMSDALDRAFSRPGMFIAITDQEAADVVAGGAARFGTTTLSLVRSEQRPLKIVTLDGVSPSPGTLEDGSYPLSKTFSFITRGAPSGETERFLAFLRSGKGREILEATGQFPLAAVSAP